MRPLTTDVARRQHIHGLTEVLLYLIPHLVVSAIGNIEPRECLIHAVIGDEHRVLIISGENVVRKAADEQCLTLNALVRVSETGIVLEL